MTMRDHLAHDRTALANERTLLAYLRTWIALVAAGGSIMEIFRENTVLEIIGSLLIATGFIILAVGILRFTSITRQIRAIHGRGDETSSAC